MRDEGDEEQGGDDDGVDDEGGATLRGGALAVDGRAHAAEDARTIHWQRWPCEAKSHRKSAGNIYGARKGMALRVGGGGGGWLTRFAGGKDAEHGGAGVKDNLQLLVRGLWF